MEPTVKASIMEYCLYARKSMEDDERQTMSIDSQIKEMTDMAVKEGLFIKEIRRESHFEQVQYREKALSDINNRLMQIQYNLDQIYDDKIEGVIDETTFQRKREKFLIEQKALDEQTQRHRIADKKYVDFGCLVLDVAHAASKIYEVRNPDQKRQLMDFVFSNLFLVDKTVQNSFKDIYQAVVEYKKTGQVLADIDKIRTFWAQNGEKFYIPRQN